MAPLKKFITYFLLVVYLFSFAETRQVLKLPNLIEHYVSHSLKDKSTTLFSFIKMHYLDTPVKDADYKQDMKLPFKTHDCSFVHFNLTIPPKSFDFSFENKLILKEVSKNFTYSEPITSQKFSSVFRPPIVG